MGLAQRKDKQKIAPDPRNLGWSQDTNRFSYQHLTKFGWDPTQGLGSTHNQGNRDHIKVVRKLDSSGIGVARAIKEGAEVGGAGEGLNALFKRLRKAGSAHEDGEGSGGSSPMVFNTSDASDDDKDDKEEEKKSKSSSTSIIAPTPLPLGNSSRSKYVRSKRLAASSPAAMAEILGIPIASLPSSPSSLSQPPPPQAGPSTLKPRVPDQGKLDASDPFVTTPADQDDEERGKHTVAKISVAEYFRRRLIQKKAEREGVEVPVFDDEKPSGGYDQVAKGFEGKKIVFPLNNDEDEDEDEDEDVKPKIEQDLDDDRERAEGGLGEAGLGSTGDPNKVRSKVGSPVLVDQEVGRRERRDWEKKEKKERKEREKREKKEGKKKKEGKGSVKVEDVKPVIIKPEPGSTESSLSPSPSPSSVRVKQEDVDVDVDVTTTPVGSSTQDEKPSGKKRKRLVEEDEERGGEKEEAHVRVKKEKKSKKEKSQKSKD